MLRSEPKLQYMITRNHRKRFTDRINIPFDATINECWEWDGAKDKDGYGVFQLRPRRTTRAHRFSYSLFKESIGQDLHVLHSCDNPSCVNPNHLSLGTELDNVRDCISKNRRRDDYTSRLTQRDLVEIKRLNNTISQYKIAKQFKISQAYVSIIVNQKQKVHLNAPL